MSRPLRYVVEFDYERDEYDRPLRVSYNCSLGTKLAKSRRSLPVDLGKVLPQLLAVFDMLGLAPPATLAGGKLADAWEWAIARWDVKCVPKRLQVSVSD